VPLKSLKTLSEKRIEHRHRYCFRVSIIITSVISRSTIIEILPVKLVRGAMFMESKHDGECLSDAKHGLSISVRLNVCKTEDILVFSQKEYMKVVGY